MIALRKDLHMLRTIVALSSDKIVSAEEANQEDYYAVDDDDDAGVAPDEYKFEESVASKLEPAKAIKVKKVFVSSFLKCS